jgi:hypothetical protein
MTGIFVMPHEKGFVHTPAPGGEHRILPMDDVHSLRMPFFPTSRAKNPAALDGIPLLSMTKIRNSYGVTVRNIHG